MAKPHARRGTRQAVKGVRCSPTNPFFMDRESEVTYSCGMSTETLANVQPKAVMTPDELARWNQLPADEQLARLRAAIQRGIDSASL
jgi:hypothetical protein